MMKRLFFSLICLSLAATPSVYGDEKKPAATVTLTTEQVAKHLQDISVTISADRATGSGIITNVGGECYVLTCGHVVAHLRGTREIIDPVSGAKKTVVEFKDAEIVKDLVEDGRNVGQMRFFGQVVRYSDAEYGEDLALLHVRKKDLTKERVSFYLDQKIPAIGTTLYHVGSLLGQSGSNSMTRGIMSQHGRLINNKVFDQTTCAAFPGSSGGGVFLEDGKYVAQIVRGAGETFNLVVPIRRIQTWAKRVNVEFVLNPDVKPISIDELKKQPIEEQGSHNQAEKQSIRPGLGKPFPFIDE